MREVVIMNERSAPVHYLTILDAWASYIVFIIDYARIILLL